MNIKLPDILGLKKFLSEIFQDQDGGASMKRTVFMFFALLFAAITGGVYFKAVGKDTMDFLQSALHDIKDILTWIGGMILGEKIPNAITAYKAAPDDKNKPA